ncbi:hypothetical protein FSP39_001189 [Pinctada imbricata]|uniref:Mab-21-like HhH/H2TH-like domain-containing protein n=1 Tax=Pinctada imbricata TaxID=66713 RepID=A0AA89BPC4_PINIB|nr:hypothetical protein FSP39_001189 [Pinctada imbricata]
MDLYNRLSYLFGTEEYVNLRRQLVLTRENLIDYNYHGKQRAICSGSLGEGITYPPSDDDVMTYETNLRVVRSYTEATQRGDLLIVPSEFSPGYCLLFDVNKSCHAKVIHVVDGKSFISSSQWKQFDLQDGESIHGPCQSQNLVGYEYDHAQCIRCTFWPDAANGWISRNLSNTWPSPEIMQNIILNGCHAVPVGDQASPYCEHEWRISFSVAERTLMHSLNHTQFLTYNFLRLCLKRVIEKKVPGVICSYFMKTALFYTAENTPIEFWRADKIEACFKACLSALYDYIDNGYCPNYFIPEYNMMKRKINHTNHQQLLDIIRSLHTAGVLGSTHYCGECHCWKASPSSRIMERQQDFDFMHSMLYVLIVQELSNVFLTPGTGNGIILSLSVLLYKILNLLQNNLTRDLITIFFQSGIIFSCQKFMHRLCSSDWTNRRNYCLHKNIDTLLRIGYRADVTTGKLTAATYMYLIGKTESALSHLRRLLSEYPPYAVETTIKDSFMTIYTDVMCGRGYTMAYKIRHAFVPPFHLFEGILNAFPMPIRIWRSCSLQQDIPIDALSYSYFLESLCYIRSHDHTSLMKSTRCLVSRLDDLSDEYEFIGIRMCISIIKYARGESQSACRWFGSAYRMTNSCEPNSFHPYVRRCVSYPIMTYIACLLNRRFKS